MTHLQFAQPHWLGIGALCCAALVALLARAGRLRGQAVSRLAGARFVTTVGRGRRLAKQLLALVGVAAAFVALARPLAGFRREEERRDGIDLMFAVDTSKSMLATDLRPDRLTRAKLAVSDLLRKFPGERVGLIAFAGEAFVQAPMTIDQAVFGEALDALDTSIIPRGGTDIASPIRAAVEAMASEPDRRKLLIILSDGEDLQGEALAAAKDAAHAGLVIYTVGVGTKPGALIPVGHDGQRELLRDADGRFVTSHLDEQTLRQLAAVTGGAYAPLGAAGQGLETLYREHLAQLPRRTVEERMHKIYTERFQIPLAVAIGCLLVELALGERRRRPDGARSRSAGSRRSGSHQSIAPVAKAAAALLLLTAGAARPAAASTTVPAASTYNDGTTAYRKKDFTAARDRFQAATHTTDLSMQEDAYYDLGNARYRVGQGTLSKDRPATIEAWKSALASYDGALALQPKDADARFNRDLVARRLAALEKQDQQERQDRQPKSRQDQKNDKDQKQGQGQQQSDKDQEQGQGQQPQPSQSSSGRGQGSSPSPQGSNGKEGSAAQGANQTGQQEQHRPEGGNPQSAAGQQQATHEQPGPKQNSEPNQDQNGGSKPPRGPGVVSGQTGQSMGKEQPTAARREPGALSPSEAVQLLDSVSGELHRLPVADARRRQAVDDRDAPAKDW